MMGRKIIYTGCFLAVCLLLLLPGGCTDERLGGAGRATGKTVMVSLEVSLQPATSPATGREQAGLASRSSVPRQNDEPLQGSAPRQNDESLQGGDAGAPFAVRLEQALPEAGTKASGSTTTLHNLWLFQFDETGAINGDPQKMDEVTATGNKVTLEVPLVVSTGQTLYLLVLGPKLAQDFSRVTTLDELEKSSFEYLASEGGYTESLITSEADVPFAGKVSGITVLDIDGGKRGLVEYNTPDGFIGAIEVRSLMARITLHYKFAVENYRLQGLKLLNVNKTIHLTNPDKNEEEADAYETLESVTAGEADAETDAEGFRVQTWYVAQNRRGTVGTILTENQRYRKVSGTTVSGEAPALGTQIEAWAYSETKADEYAIYQMYVGNNNTSNFDVDPNHFYNLRTSINAELSSAKSDERIRAYTAEQSINFRASAVTGGTYGSYDKPDAKYDLDAHCDTRPITIKASGRAVSVGVYTDKDGTTPVSVADSWLRLSSSSNYTEAYNNTKEPLSTLITTKTVLPTELKFYLYNDEYIYKEDGATLLDKDKDGNGGKRSLYIKITTATEGDGGTTQASTVYRMDQRPAIYAGRFGGEKENGVFTMGLLCEQIDESGVYYSEDKAQQKGSTYPGYSNVNTAGAGYGTDDMDNGKNATRNLSEDPQSLSQTDIRVAAVQKDASGHILLYQYQYTSIFAARACYDLNRDENGNGIIDAEEFKWYLPASNQVLGIHVGCDIKTSVSTTERSGYSTFNYLYNSRLMSQNKSQQASRLCVRDVPLPYSK